MNQWFAANILFKSVHSSPQAVADTLWEESIRLVSAETLEDAHRKAELLGRSAEVSFDVNESDRVRWVFVKVERIFEIRDESFAHGLEVFSRFLRQSEVESILKPFDDN